MPDPIANCTAYNATAYTMQFACIPGNDGGIKQSFFVEVIDDYANEVLRQILIFIKIILTKGIRWQGENIQRLIGSANVSTCSPTKRLEAYRAGN